MCTGICLGDVPVISSPLIYPLTTRVVRAPQMISQPVSSIFPCSPLPSGTWRTPGLSIPWCCLPTSSSVCLIFFPFHCALQDGFPQTWWTGDMSILLQFASLYDGQEIFVWSNCLRDLGTDFLVGNIIFVWHVQYFGVAPHLHGLYSSLELCCEGPRFTSIQEDGCDKGAHQSYLGAERNTPIIPNWFQPCQCCCCLCYPGEYIRLGTFISYNWAQVLEACDSLKLLSMYFDLFVDATCAVCHQLSLLGADLHAIRCGGFVETLP